MFIVIILFTIILNYTAFADHNTTEINYSIEDPRLSSVYDAMKHNYQQSITVDETTNRNILLQPDADIRNKRNTIERSDNNAGHHGYHEEYVFFFQNNKRREII